MNEVEFCRICRRFIHESDKFCPWCDAIQTMAPNKNRYVAATLAFFLGGTGAHKFYLRQFRQGAYYLIFSWTFLPLVVSLVESVRYIMMSEESFDKRYN